MGQCYSRQTGKASQLLHRNCGSFFRLIDPPTESEGGKTESSVFQQQDGREKEAYVEAQDAAEVEDNQPGAVEQSAKMKDVGGGGEETETSVEGKADNSPLIGHAVDSNVPHPHLEEPGSPEKANEPRIPTPPPVPVQKPADVYERLKKRRKRPHRARRKKERQPPPKPEAAPPQEPVVAAPTVQKPNASPSKPQPKQAEAAAVEQPAASPQKVAIQQSQPKNQQPQFVVEPPVAQEKHVTIVEPKSQQPVPVVQKPNASPPKVQPKQAEAAAVEQPAAAPQKVAVQQSQPKNRQPQLVVEPPAAQVKKQSSWLEEEEEEEEEVMESSSDEEVDGTLEVMVLHAQNIPQKFGKTYVTVTLQESPFYQEYKTKTAKAPYPEWNENFIFDVTDFRNQRLQTTIYQKRTLKKDKFVGWAVMAFHNLRRNGVTGDLTVDLLDMQQEVVGQITASLTFHRPASF